MSKLFGYPEFDSNGEMILTTYDNDYSEMMMDIRVYKLKKDEKRVFMRQEEETAVLLLAGNVVYKWDDVSAEAARRDVFTEGPWCVHVCRNNGVEVTAVEDSEILVQ